MSLNKSFVNKYDDGKKVFSNIVGKDPLIGKLINESGPIIGELKKHFNIAAHIVENKQSYRKMLKSRIKRLGYRTVMGQILFQHYPKHLRHLPSRQFL